MLSRLPKEVERQLPRGGTMRTVAKIIGVLTLSALFVLPISQAYASSMSKDIDSSLDYLAQHQDSIIGGIFEESDKTPSAMLSGWTAIAFASAGYDPVSVGTGIINFIKQDACQLTSATDIERTILVASAAGLDSSSFGSCDLSANLNALIDAKTGKIGNDIVSTIFGVLAVRSQDKSVDQNTVDYIVASQAIDGGWSSGWGTEANITAQAVMALASTGYATSSPVISNAKHYLKSLQTNSGGIKYDSNAWTTEPDAFSNAYTLQAIYALGEDPLSDYWTRGDKSIIDDLTTLRQADGSYNFSATLCAMNPVFTTAVVLPALNGKAMPVIGDDLKKFTPPVAQNQTPQPTSPTQSDDTAETTDVAPVTTQTPIAPTIEDHTRGNIASVASETDPPAEEQIADTSTASQPSDKSNDKSYTIIIICSTGLLIGIGLSIMLGRVGILPILLAIMIAIPANALASQASVVVRHGNGNMVKRCVDFGSTTITGLELLQKAGLSPVLENGFMVSIDGDKAKSSTEPGVTDDYWSYWRIDNNKWSYSRAGASSQKVGDGDVQGWQRGGSTLMLPTIKFDDICTKKAQDVAVASVTPSVSPLSRGRADRADAKLSSPTVTSTTASTNIQTATTSSPQAGTDTTNNNRTDYFNALYLIGFAIAGFGAHRFFKKMRGSI